MNAQQLSLWIVGVVLGVAITGWAVHLFLDRLTRRVKPKLTATVVHEQECQRKLSDVVEALESSRVIR